MDQTMVLRGWPGFLKGLWWARVSLDCTYKFRMYASLMWISTCAAELFLCCLPQTAVSEAEVARSARCPIFGTLYRASQFLSVPQAQSARAEHRPCSCASVVSIRTNDLGCCTCHFFPSRSHVNLTGDPRRGMIPHFQIALLSCQLA